MKILIEFYDEDCEPCANGVKPKRHYECSSIAEALMAIGMIERHEHMPSDEEATAERVKDF